MISIALIGADGAGKTTIAEMLQTSFPKPIKYLYMGINAESSNVGLPTTRFIESLKQNKRKTTNGVPERKTSLHEQEAILKKKGALKTVWLYIRTLNRLAEEWYRQWLSWRYRKNGFIVLYDRHFLFDFDKKSLQDAALPIAEKIHRWCLQRFYPQPDLVLFLDAPAEVLFARKGEATLEFLTARREAYLEQGDLTRNFQRVDATQDVHTVFKTVCKHINETLPDHNSNEAEARSPKANSTLQSINN